MSDFKKGDTASWDAGEVRRARREQAGREEGTARRRRRRRINPLMYLLCVLLISALLAGIGWCRIFAHSTGEPLPR